MICTHSPLSPPAQAACAFRTAPHTHSPAVRAVSAMISVRSDAELHELFDCLPDMEGIDFYYNQTVGQLLKHLVVKVGGGWW